MAEALGTGTGAGVDGMAKDRQGLGGWRLASTGSGTSPVRINRFTGDADALVPREGWVPVEEPWQDEEKPPDGSAS